MKADLSDLQEKIKWCRVNDRKCEEIAENAQKLYNRFVAKEGILDYMQLICFEIAKRFHRVPRSFEKAVPSLPCPVMPGADVTGRTSCCKEGLCIICETLKSIEDEKLALTHTETTDSAKAKQNKKRAEIEANKEKMRERARKKQRRESKEL